MNLKGRRGLVVGVANTQSIAWGCAKALHTAGAELAITYLNAKAEPHVRPLAEQIDASIVMPLDVEHEGELEAVFDTIDQAWGKLDFVIHSIAYAPKDDLHGRLTDSSRDGFLRAMDVSCHSFLRIAKLAEPLMRDGGCLLTMTYQGAKDVFPGYGLMGPVKAALESAVRYMAAELGGKNIRVNAISPGPLPTRAASGIRDFSELLAHSRDRAPLLHTVNIDDVGALCAFLVSDAACALTGSTIPVDGGYHVIG